MTSQLNVDTIVDKAGSGGTNVKIGNTSTYVSDGGNVTQNTVQGLAKAWVNIDGSGTISIKDSFNGSSVTDRGSSQYTATFTNSMSTVNYAITGTMGFDNVNGTGYLAAPLNTAISTWKTTSYNQMDFYHANTTRHGSDANDVADVIHGDLA